MSAESSWRTTAARGGYWSEEEGREAVAAWRASGLSLRAFAARHGVSAPRLARWRDRTDEGSKPPAFATLRVQEGASIALREAAVVRIDVGAVRVEISECERAPVAWIASLVRALS